MPVKSLIVKITDISKEGFGLTQDNNQIILVENALPGELVEIEIIKKNRHFAQAKITKMITQSPQRRKPQCKHYEYCGGCSLQHLTESFYLSFKQNILQEHINKLSINNKVKADFIYIGPQARRKAKFKVNNGKIGYYAPKTNIIFNLEECLLLEPEILNHVKLLQKNLKDLLPINLVQEINITASDSCIDLIIITNSKFQLELDHIDKLSKYAKLHHIGKISIKGKNITPIITLTQPQIHLADVKVNLPDEYFLQASSKAQNIMLEYIIFYLKNFNSKKVIDLYAGCGTYSIPTSNITKCKSVEGSLAMVGALKQAKIDYNLINLMEIENKDLFNNPIITDELNRYDFIIINPPRNGAEPQIKQIATSIVKYVVIISCNLTSFYRDISILTRHDYKIIEVKLIDQFYLSTHMEILTLLAKSTLR